MLSMIYHRQQNEKHFIVGNIAHEMDSVLALLNALLSAALLPFSMAIACIFWETLGELQVRPSSFVLSLSFQRSLFRCHTLHASSHCFWLLSIMGSIPYDTIALYMRCAAENCKYCADIMTISMGFDGNIMYHTKRTGLFALEKRVDGIKIMAPVQNRQTRIIDPMTPVESPSCVMLDPKKPTRLFSLLEEKEEDEIDKTETQFAAKVLLSFRKLTPSTPPISICLDSSVRQLSTPEAFNLQELPYEQLDLGSDVNWAEVTSLLPFSDSGDSLPRTDFELNLGHPRLPPLRATSWQSEMCSSKKYSIIEPRPDIVLGYLGKWALDMRYKNRLPHQQVWKYLDKITRLQTADLEHRERDVQEIREMLEYPPNIPRVLTELLSVLLE